MTKTYAEREKERQAGLIQAKDEVFYGAEGGGLYDGKKSHEYILKDAKCNFYAPIQAAACEYFAENGIKWWGGDGRQPTGDTVSSQVACLNHLFALRKDKDAVLDLVNGIRGEYEEVLPLACDKEGGYIAFEVVSDKDHLNEQGHTRGEYCTSVDALLLAKRQDGKRILFRIEWKYTESYGNVDRSTEVTKDGHDRGKVRLLRYTELINASRQLKTLESYVGSVYYREPFYQMMRQTLWADQMIAHRDEDLVQADDFVHVDVIPRGSEGLEGVEATWREMLTDQSKYVVTTPRGFRIPRTQRLR